MNYQTENMSNVKNKTISHDGMFKNMTSFGFNNLNYLSEKIDNSLSAKATNIFIRINQHNRQIIISDNGEGMNKDDMINCGCVHNRSNVTQDKHGRFGAGDAFANVGLTGQQEAYYISNPKNKSDDDDDNQKYSLSLHYNDTYEIRPEPASNRHIREYWDKYAIDKEYSGTVQILESTQKIINKIMQLIKDNSINSYRFELSKLYTNFINNNFEIKFIINEEEYIITPFDNMKYNLITDTDRTHHIIKCFKTNKDNIKYFIIDNSSDNEIIFYTKNINQNKVTYKQNKINKKKYREEIKNYIAIGDIALKNVYHNDWENFNKKELDKLNISTINSSKEVILNTFGGCKLVRNNKQIGQFEFFDSISITSANIPFLRNIHTEISYSASEIMDDEIFQIQVNKSEIKKENFDIDLYNIIKKTIQKFMNKIKSLYPNHTPTPTPPQSPTPTPPQSPTPTPPQSPTPTPPQSPTPTPLQSPRPTPPHSPKPTLLHSPTPTPPHSPKPILLHSPTPTPTPPQSPKVVSTFEKTEFLNLLKNDGIDYAIDYAKKNNLNKIFVIRETTNYIQNNM